MKELKKPQSIFVYSLILIPVFIWIGFVCSISFMEAWLKFRAPNVSLSIGLGIGKLVFNTLNKVEWSFAALITIFILINSERIKLKNNFPFYLAILSLVLQTVFLLPSLNESVEAISLGLNVSSSFTHHFYIFLEVFKVSVLFIFGLNIICNLTNDVSTANF